MNKPYRHKPRLCVWCDDTYMPTSGAQKYCKECKQVAWNHRKLEWWKKHGRQWDRQYKILHRSGPHQEAIYTHNDITTNTDFLDRMRDRIRKQKGDMFTVKKAVRYILNEMGVYKDTSVHARKVCYIATEIIVTEEFNGEFYSKSFYGGTTFKLPRRERHENG